jgi:hypothetical protein
MLTQYSWTDPTALEKKGLQTTSPAHRLTNPQVPTQFLSPHSNWSSRLKPSICWWKCYIILLDPYLLYVISTFNTSSQRATHRSLTDTDGGHNLRGIGFQHHSTHPTQPMVLRFPLRTLSSLKLKSKHKPPAIKCIEATYNSRVVSIPLGFYRNPIATPSIC